MAITEEFKKFEEELKELKKKKLSAKEMKKEIEKIIHKYPKGFIGFITLEVLEEAKKPLSEKEILARTKKKLKEFGIEFEVI
ncbi:MAG: hypothetical protein ACE5KE_00350 [Methanosarcinales archaeon]